MSPLNAMSNTLHMFPEGPRQAQDQQGHAQLQEDLVEEKAMNRGINMSSIMIRTICCDCIDYFFYSDHLL